MRLVRGEGKQKSGIHEEGVTPLDYFRRVRCDTLEDRVKLAQVRLGDSRCGANIFGDRRRTFASHLRSSNYFFALDLFSFTAARMSAFSAFSFIFSPSRKSMARRVFPSRLELKRPEGSFREAPLANVIFTTLLYVSPVLMIPSCSHTGTPRHFHVSTTSGSASLTRARSRPSVSPRQSASSLIR